MDKRLKPKVIQQILQKVMPAWNSSSVKGIAAFGRIEVSNQKPNQLLNLGLITINSVPVNQVSIVRAYDFRQLLLISPKKQTVYFES
jgi:hypothetical protein